MPRPGAIIRDLLGRAVLGMDVVRPAGLDALEPRSATIAAGHHMAFSAIDIAVWDAAARSANVSIAALLGGALRDNVACVRRADRSSSRGRTRIATSTPTSTRYLRAGFRAMKMRMGVAPRTDGERLRRVRERVGLDFPLMVDLNEGASVRSALAYGEAFRDSRTGMAGRADCPRQSRWATCGCRVLCRWHCRRRRAVRPRRIPRVRVARRAGRLSNPTSRCAVD